jgi:UDP-N-acetylglucosamine--N-acetylmuramyl-(pentapeptide) pyrophosphoryl-undecaprenol N-acetylglucosamine transferase
MCVNFKNLESKNRKIVYTGPIFSKNYEKTTKDYSNLNIDKSKPTILIIGGSLGSRKINENVFAILKDLLSNYNIIHITGKGNNKVKSHDNYNAFEMTDNMVNLYNIA